MGDTWYFKSNGEMLNLADGRQWKESREFIGCLLVIYTKSSFRWTYREGKINLVTENTLPPTDMAIVGMNASHDELADITICVRQITTYTNVWSDYKTIKKLKED